MDDFIAKMTRLMEQAPSFLFFLLLHFVLVRSIDVFIGHNPREKLK